MSSSKKTKKQSETKTETTSNLEINAYHIYQEAVARYWVITLIFAAFSIFMLSREVPDLLIKHHQALMFIGYFAWIITVYKMLRTELSLGVYSRDMQIFKIAWQAEDSYRDCKLWFTIANVFFTAVYGAAVYLKAKLLCNEVNEGFNGFVILFVIVVVGAGYIIMHQQRLNSLYKLICDRWDLDVGTIETESFKRRVEQLKKI